LAYESFKDNPDRMIYYMEETEECLNQVTFSMLQAESFEGIFKNIIFSLRDYETSVFKNAIDPSFCFVIIEDVASRYSSIKESNIDHYYWIDNTLY
jgi:hypothetical protein